MTSVKKYLMEHEHLLLQGDTYIKIAELVSLDDFPQWITKRVNLDFWTQHTFEPENDPIMLQHMAMIFENPQLFSAETIYRIAMRGGRILERIEEKAHTTSNTPQKLYEMYHHAFNAIKNCGEKDNILTTSLELLLHDQDIFTKKNHSSYEQKTPQSKFDILQGKREAVEILHKPHQSSPEEIFETTIAYAALQTWKYKASEVPARVLHAYRKGLNALAGCKGKDTDYILFLTKLFSDASIFVQQQALKPIRRANENAYQRRDGNLKPREKPPKPLSVPIELYADTAAKRNDRVTVMLFKKASGTESSPISLHDRFYMQQRHPRPYPEEDPDWYGYEWEGVGGGITEIPSALETARLEVEQETGLAHAKLSYFGTIPATEKEKRQNWIYTGIISDDTPIVLSREHIQYRWVTVEEALSRPLARDHEAIFRQMCLEKGDQSVQDFIKAQKQH